MVTVRNVYNLGLVFHPSVTDQGFIDQLSSELEDKEGKWEKTTSAIPELSNILISVPKEYRSSLVSTVNEMHEGLNRQDQEFDLTIVVADFLNDQIDPSAAMFETGLASDTPIATLVPLAKGHIGGGSNIIANQIDALRILSLGSGVSDMPLRLKGTLGTTGLDNMPISDFVDHLIVLSAARAGALDQVKSQGLVSSKIWKQISDTSFQTINEPVKPEGNRRIFAPVPLALTGVGGFILGTAMCIGYHQWTHEEPICPAPLEITQPALPSKITDDLDSGTSIRFNNASIGFEANSAEIPAHFKPALNEVGQYLEDNPSAYSKLIIEGHTSTEGPDDYNKDLSTRRANAIVDYLNNNFVIRDGLLEAQGYGEERPIHNPDITEFQKEENRRVILIPQL